MHLGRKILLLVYWDVLLMGVLKLISRGDSSAGVQKIARSQPGVVRTITCAGSSLFHFIIGGIKQRGVALR